ncbi:alanine racemase C-terminal domain-containing protein [Microbacterium ureisolvens]|uniref:alanine racemase C-terminal domain-containing protein n=1 Tax=Microbacterium ureisolvens TaxID=2781186 RepID=UPI00362A3693
MSSSIPGHHTSVPGSTARSAPVARISRSALAGNARSARERGMRSFDPSILRADAWGHGARLVQEILDAEGFSGEKTVPGEGVDRLDSRAMAEPAEHVLSGRLLYGLPGSEAAPALRLTGTVLSVKDLRAGEGVSYGYAFRASEDTRVALVTGGYAQGIVRSLGGAVEVACAGDRHPIVGRVAMDVCVIEIGGAPVRRGDEVIFLGDPRDGEPSLSDWIRATGLRDHELITAVGLRATREEAR